MSWFIRTIHYYKQLVRTSQAMVRTRAPKKSNQLMIKINKTMRDEEDKEMNVTKEVNKLNI